MSGARFNYTDRDGDELAVAPSNGSGELWLRCHMTASATDYAASMAAVLLDTNAVRDLRDTLTEWLGDEEPEPVKVTVQEPDVEDLRNQVGYLIDGVKDLRHGGDRVEDVLDATVNRLDAALRRIDSLEAHVATQRREAASRPRTLGRMR